MKIFARILVFLGSVMLAATAHATWSEREEAIHNIHRPVTLEEVQAYALGTWESISIELRPTEDRTGQGTVTPTYATRKFTYLSADRFTGTITLYGDNYGEMPLMAFEFTGEVRWGDAHPIAEGAYEIDYVLSESFAVTPLIPPAADMLNQIPVAGIDPFQAGVTQDILGKPFPLFNIAENQIVADYDLIYFRNGMLFMGAKHVDGTPFDRPDRRPHQLQIPLVRVSQ